MKTFTPLSALLEGISEKLYAAFDKGTIVYPESVTAGIKRDLKRPCFFIKPLKPSNTIERDRTYVRDNPYCIHYYPKNINNPVQECYRILDSLYIALEYIEVNGNPVRGTGMHGEIHDEILLFYVSYNIRVRKIYDVILMEYLEMIEFRTKQ